MKKYVRFFETNKRFWQIESFMMIPDSEKSPVGFREMQSHPGVGSYCYDSLEDKFIVLHKPASGNAVFDGDSGAFFISEDGLMDELRQNRDALIQSCDWIVTKSMEQGVPVPAPWVTYRQALRDVTEQPGAPHVIDWPVPPAG